MAFFSVKLNELMSRNGWHAAELSRLSGLPAPKISRWLNDVQRYVDPPDLAALADALGRSPVEKAQLLQAYLLDMCVGPGADMVSIEITDTPCAIKEDHRPPLAPEMEKAFAMIKTQLHDEDIRRIILGLGKVSEKLLLRTLDKYKQDR